MQICISSGYMNFNDYRKNKLGESMVSSKHPYGYGYGGYNPYGAGINPDGEYDYLPEITSKDFYVSGSIKFYGYICQNLALSLSAEYLYGQIDDIYMDDYPLFEYDGVLVDLSRINLSLGLVYKIQFN